MIRLTREQLADHARAAEYEWLQPDGLGGYSSSTALGLDTRREHGLLVVATRPPRGRLVLLSKLEETLVLAGESHALSTHQFGETIHPQGCKWAAAFDLDPLPTLTWELPDARLTRTIARVHGEPGVIVLYRYDGPGEARLDLRPLLAYREPSALQRENPQLRRDAELQAEWVLVRPYDLCPPLGLLVHGAAWRAEPCWYQGFTYVRDHEARLEGREDLFSPGLFSAPLAPGASVALVAWAGRSPAFIQTESVVAEERRRLREAGPEVDGALGLLRRAAEGFVVPCGETGRSVVSGYPWTPDSARETLLGLPGLCLATGHVREARAVLAELVRHLKTGLLPGRFGEWDEPPQYNSADAGMWLVIALHRVAEATGDVAFLRARLRDSLVALLDALCLGRARGLALTADGLLSLAPGGELLTWMDRPADGQPCAPRCGQPIEIQALWYNALLLGADLASKVGEELRAREWTALAARVREAVQRLFWLEEQGYLADVVDGEQRDSALRPNQLYAIGLPHCLLPGDKAARVMEAVERELLTPVGLRTLAPSDPAYRGRRAEASPTDRADYSGSVWPFLIGIYFDAAIRLRGEAAKQEARDWLKGFAAHLEEAGLGFVSAVLDGDPPHRPGGLTAHAAGVGELLRLAARVAGRPPVMRAGAPRSSLP